MIGQETRDVRAALDDYDARARRYRPRVLLAEDDESFRLLLHRWLDVDGYRVTGVATGSALVECLATMSQHKDPPSLVISDDRLPGVRGLRALQQARDRGWASPFVLITAFGSAELVAEAEKSSIHVLGKPFEIDDLRTIVGWLAPRIDATCLACGTPDELQAVHSRGNAMFCKGCRGLIEDFDHPVDLGGES